MLFSNLRVDEDVIIKIDCILVKVVAEPSAPIIYALGIRKHANRQRLF